MLRRSLFAGLTLALSGFGALAGPVRLPLLDGRLFGARTLGETELNNEGHGG